MTSPDDDVDLTHGIERTAQEAIEDDLSVTPELGTEECPDPSTSQDIAEA